MGETCDGGVEKTMAQDCERTSDCENDGKYHDCKGKREELGSGGGIETW